MVGAGIWILSSPEGGTMVIPLCVTLIALLWSIGAMTNLSSDFPTFSISMPLLIGQSTIFWLLYGGFGLSISFCLLSITCLMLISVSHSTRVFQENIVINLQKDKLLKAVKDENYKTQEALREARLANSAKAYLMAAAAHDVKQPLLALAMLTDTVLLSDLPEAVVPLVRQQRSSIDHMSDYVDALMDMRSFLKGDYELSFARFRLQEFGFRIGSEIGPLCAAKDLTWSLDMDDVLVETDYQLLQRLFRNLLINAVQYTDHGSIVCSAKADGNVVKCLISDTGIGIAAEHQEVIFEDFVRLRVAGPDTTGSGLGLSIVRKISQALGLDLQLSSTVGKGTRFSFQLPVVT
jgi:signal transduction histidine kinase